MKAVKVTQLTKRKIPTYHVVLEVSAEEIVANKLGAFGPDGDLYMNTDIPLNYWEQPDYNEKVPF